MAILVHKSFDITVSNGASGILVRLCATITIITAAL